MDQYDSDIYIKVAQMEIELKNLNCTVENLKENQELLTRLVCNVEQLAKTMDDMNTKIANMQVHIDDIERIPAEKWKNASKTAHSTIVSTVVQAIVIVVAILVAMFFFHTV